MFEFRAMVLAAATPLLVVCAVGCAAGAGERAGLGSRYPLDRALAVVRSAERGDSEAVHKLVDLLEDMDPAVRMYAIGALRRLTGEDFEYRHYGPEEERNAAVERWRTAIRENRIGVVTKPRDAAAPAASVPADDAVASPRRGS